MTKITAPKQLRIDQQVTTSVERITPARAKEWLGRNEANRNLRAVKVNEYARDMAAGKWSLSGESIKFDYNGNLIDGQHRLTAGRESGVTFESVVVRGLPPTVRSVIDTGAKRSAGDALKMAGLSVGGKSVAAVTTLSMAIHRGQVLKAGERTPQATHSEVIDFYDQHRDVLDYAIYIGNHYARALNARPSALGAAAFVAATNGLLDEFANFIAGIADLDFRGTSDPRATLYKRMTSLRLEKHQASEEVYFILRAFDAHVRGQGLVLMKSATGQGRSHIPTKLAKAAA